MKKILWRGLLLLFMIALVCGLLIWYLGAAYLKAAPAMATGMAAKLGCSAKYISEFSEIQARRDLESYSVLLKFLSLHYDDAERRVTASLLGSQTSASYQPGLGCAIEFAGVTGRLGARVSPPVASDALWPMGSTVATEPRADALLAEQLAQDNAAGWQTRALVLVRDGQLIAESYADGVSPNTQLLGWSMTKSVVAIAIGRLIQLGKLSLDETHLFPEWAGDGRAQITLRQLLTMTDGLDFNEVYRPGADATAMLFTEPSSAGYALTRPLKHKAGRVFNYASGTANLLSRLLRQRSGGTLQAQLNFLREYLYQPMGLTYAHFEADAAGDLVGSSYLYASARDWARFGLLMLNQGQINGVRLLERDYVQQAVQPNASNNEKAYGFQFWLNRGDGQLRWPDLPEATYAALGNRAQIMMVIPSENLVFVRLGWSDGSYPTNANVQQLLKRLARP